MSQVQQQEQVKQPEQQAQPSITQPARVKKKRDIRGFINSPYLLLLVPLLVGGFFLVLNPQYVTLAMNYPFSAVFILAIPVALFLVKLVINFFSVIEKWIRLQFEKARQSKKGHFFELVTGVFMFVSVCEAGPFFNDIQHNMLGGALGYATVLAFDLIAVICIDTRRKELAKGGTKAGRSLLGVFLCAGVSMIANLYSALVNYQPPSDPTFPALLKSVAPYVGIAFPIMIVFLAFSRDAEIEIDDAETYRKQQQKRVDFLAARRELMEKITNEMIHIDLLKQREFFLKGWLFTKKKMNAVIEVATQQVMENIKADVTTLKQSILDEVNGLRQAVIDEITAIVTNKVSSSTTAQVNELVSENATLKSQLQQLQADRENEKREFGRQIERLQSLITSQIEQQNNAIDRRLFDLQAQLEQRFNGVIDSAVTSSIEAAQEVVKEAAIVSSQEAPKQEVKQDRNTDEMPVIRGSQRDSGALTDPDVQAMLIHYPILEQWLSRGVKSLTLEEIVETTNHSRKMVINRIKDGTFAKTKNPNRFRMDSILTWLKDAPLPKRQEESKGEAIDASYGQVESSVNEVDAAGQETPTNGNHNGHSNGHHEGESPLDLPELEVVG